VQEKKIRNFEERLLEEHRKLLKSIQRNRLASEEVVLDHTEDEGDLAIANHNRELLQSLGEADYRLFNQILNALVRLKRGEYGICVRCEEDINEKRLNAVPWATLCLGCQSAAETESAGQRKMGAGFTELDPA